MLRRRRLDLDLQPKGQMSRVLLDGEMVPGVHKVVVTSEAGQVTRVDLECFQLGEPLRYSFLVVERLEENAP